MAYFKRGNWGYNPYKKYKSGYSKKGQYKAAAQSRDSLKFVIKCNHAFVAKYNSAQNSGTAVINIYDVLRENQQFKSFQNLYDQIKVNSVRVNLNVTDAETFISDVTSVKTINIVTAWDRTGISRDNVKFLKNNPSTEPNAPAFLDIDPINYDTESATAFVYKIGKGIVNVTGSKKSILNTYQRWNSFRAIYASTMEEKSSYLSTDNFQKFIDYNNIGDNGNGNYISPDVNGSFVNTFFNSSNPCVPFESPSCKWKPTLMVGVFKTGISENELQVSNYEDCGNVIFNAEFSIDVTFRNLKPSL